MWEAAWFYTLFCTAYDRQKLWIGLFPPDLLIVARRVSSQMTLATPHELTVLDRTDTTFWLLMTECSPLLAMCGIFNLIYQRKRRCTCWQKLILSPWKVLLISEIIEILRVSIYPVLMRLGLLYQILVSSQLKHIESQSSSDFGFFGRTSL